MYKLFFVISCIFLTNSIQSQNDFNFDFLTSSTTIGGYGELHYNKSITDEKTENTLDFHRFVMFIGHQWNEDWSFKAEVELEHNFVSDGDGELELEQAYVDYHYDDFLGLQAGVLLPSVGLLNEYHEPPLFFGVERPEYHKSIIPTTWFGNGIALYGNYSDIHYKLTVMEGLNADKISPSSGIRSARQKGFKSNADDLLYNGRIDYLGISGLRVGFSFSYNNSTGDSINIPVSLIEAHLQYIKDGLYVTGEFGNINYGKGDLEVSTGFYVDLGYDFGNLIRINTKIIPFVRYTNYNTASATAAGGDSEKLFEKSKWMLGLNILPISEVVFKIDYGETETKLSGDKIKYFNLGAGYMF